MALKIVWTKRADRSFDKIIEYLEVEWGNKVVRSFVKKTYDLFDILMEFPEIGSIENEEKSIRGFTLIKQVTVFYKIKENELIILHFFDNRQNPKKKRL